MSEQSSSNNRPPQSPAQRPAQKPAQKTTPAPSQAGGNSGPNSGRRPQGRHNNRRRHHRPNPNQETRPNPNGGNQQQRPDNRQSSLIDRIYEKYQNLLEQHIIARKKFHDLFYRADLQQRNKLERHFYSTLKDLRDFEARLNPAEKELFEKRNNGLGLDTTYSTQNAELLALSTQVISAEPSDPHYMQSQKATTYRDDKEESIGSKADYEKYKLTH